MISAFSTRATGSDERYAPPTFGSIKQASTPHYCLSICGFTNASIKSSDVLFMINEVSTLLDMEFLKYLWFKHNLHFRCAQRK